MSAVSLNCILQNQYLWDVELTANRMGENNMSFHNYQALTQYILIKERLWSQVPVSFSCSQKREGFVWMLKRSPLYATLRRVGEKIVWYNGGYEDNRVPSQDAVRGVGEQVERPEGQLPFCIFLGGLKAAWEFLSSNSYRTTRLSAQKLGDCIYFFLRILAGLWNVCGQAGAVLWASRCDLWCNYKKTSEKKNNALASCDRRSKFFIRKTFVHLTDTDWLFALCLNY